MLRPPPMKTMIIEEILLLRLRKAADLQEVVHVATNDVLLRLRASWNILRISLITEKGNLKILFPILSKIIDQIECTFSFKMSFALGFLFQFRIWKLNFRNICLDCGCNALRWKIPILERLQVANCALMWLGLHLENPLSIQKSVKIKKDFKFENYPN